MYNKENPFDRSGFASLDDLDTVLWWQIFKELEDYQRFFLEKEDEFRSPSYIWPRDPLYTWSRVWEYPYVVYHLEKWRSQQSNQTPLVVDLGSGVTFFPLNLVAKGFQVSAIDTDPVGERDYPLACDVLNVSQQNLKFRLADAKSLPFDDGLVDIVYSVSVLEHIPEPHEVLGEINRVLRPDGLLILTIDISLDGIYEITPEPFLELQKALSKNFSPLFPETCIHPLRMLTTYNSPYPYLFPKGQPIRTAARKIRRYMRGLSGKSPRLLSCYGFVGYPKKFDVT